MKNKKIQILGSLVAIVVFILIVLVWKDKSDGPLILRVEGGAQEYKNENYGFSLSLPEKAVVSEVEESILIKNENFEMQISVSEFDEEVTLTAERIKRDIPDMKMGAVESVKVGPSTDSGSSIEAVAFIDMDDDTRQIWFVYQNNFYQISADSKDDAIVGEIMKSWKWN